MRTHYAFDLGLVAISDNYRVLVHSRLTDYFPQAGIGQFNNQECFDLMLFINLQHSKTSKITFHVSLSF